MNTRTTLRGHPLHAWRRPGLLAAAVAAALLGNAGGLLGTSHAAQPAAQARGAAVADQVQRFAGPLSALPGGGYLSVRREAGALSVQRYTPDGSPAGAQTRIAVSLLPGGQPGSLTALAQGGYVLTWLGPSPNPYARWDADYPLVVQRYGAGGAFLGAEQEILTQPFARRFPPPALPQVAALPGGGYALAWVQYRDGGFGLYTRRYGADGAADGPVQLVASSASGPLSMVATASGGHVLVWGYTSLFARAYGADGTALGSAQAVGMRSASAGFPADQRTGLAALADGGAVVTWGNQTSASHVYARRLRADGALSGEAFIVDGATAAKPGPELQTASSVAALADGGYVVAWLAPGGAVHGRRFAADGAPLGSVTRLNTAAAGAPGPTVVSGGNGGFAVTWPVSAPDGTIATYGRFFDAKALLGPAS